MAADRDRPYLQSGLNDYGKPILDRTMRRDVPLAEAVKIALLSFDATIRSTIGVAPPIDFFVKAKDLLQPVDLRRVPADDPHAVAVRSGYAGAIRAALAVLPLPDWLDRAGS